MKVFKINNSFGFPNKSFANPLHYLQTVGLDRDCGLPSVDE
jgi:hypothetical protein